MGDIPNNQKNTTGVEDVTTGYDLEINSSNEALVHDQDLLTVAEGLKPTHPGPFFNEFLENGGSSDLNVDGSSTPVDFTLSPPSGKIYHIHKVLIGIEDTSINHDKFGGITGGLTNGILFKVKENGTERDLIPVALKKNAGFYVVAFDVTISSSTTDILVARWDFSDSGTTLKLQDSTSDYLKLTVQDDLTTITQFKVLVQGYEVTE
jgi:hypothetical protein